MLNNNNKKSLCVETERQAFGAAQIVTHCTIRGGCWTVGQAIQLYAKPY